MKTEKKKLFVFNVDHCIDIITNSSSELFILEGSTKEIVEEMVTSVYPDYKTEYQEVSNLYDLDDSDLSMYLDYLTEFDMYNLSKKSIDKFPIIKGLTFDQMYTPSEWQSGKGDLEYRLSRELFEVHRDKLIDHIDPTRSIWVLLSLSDNPNWEYQQMLEGLGQRYHLG